MKKVILVFCAAIMIIGLVACAPARDSGDNVADEPATVFFTGVIAEINDSTALVTPNEGEQIRRSGDAVYVQLDSSDFAVGDTIKVGYDGSVMESYPLQINMISIEKVE